MDNLTHSLVGLTAAKAGLDKVSPGATTLCILAANAPDVDVAILLFGDRWTYLHHHRGITHAILGVAVLAFLLINVTALVRDTKGFKIYRAVVLTVLGLFVLAMGTPAADVFAAGFLFGYLVYDMTHYHVHHHRPTSRLGKLVRELHMRHHFQDDTRGFGVSAPWWDHAFGTAPRGRRGER
mgnify:CR=1 FL=1